jgi:hypothetical protein
MERPLMLTLLLIVAAAMMLAGTGCSRATDVSASGDRWPQFRPQWARDGRWDPHWVRNEPYRPWPL